MASASNRPARFAGFDSTLVARAALLAFAAVLFALPAAAQGNEDEGYRDSLVMDSNGDALVIWSPEGSTDVSLELRLRDPGDNETLLADDGRLVTTTAGSEYIIGFGSNPAFNSGTTAFMAGLETVDDGHTDLAQAMCTADTTTLSIIAEARGGSAGSAVDPDNSGGTSNDFTLCNLEPMPAINASGQVAFGAHVDLNGGASITFGDCENNSASEFADETKAVVRYTSGGSPALECLLVGGDSITVAPPFIGSSTAHTVTDIGFTHLGGTVFNSSGHASALVWLDNDITTRADIGGAESPMTYTDDRIGLVYLRANGNSSLIAATGPDSIYQELMKAVINDSGQALFKGEERTGSSNCGYYGYGCSEADSSLNLWTSGGGTSIIVETGDQAPNSDYYYQGFSPHYTLNSSGDVAYVAGLNENPDPTAGSRNCGQGVYYWNGSTVTEIARAMDDWNDWDVGCTTDTGGSFTTSFNGFDFHEIGSMASVTDSGWVFFVVENYDAVSGGVCDGLIPDDDEVTMLLGWHPSFGMVEIMREGFEFEGEIVNRIFAPMPELRDQTAGSNFAVTVVFDTDRDCVDFDSDDTTEVVVPDVEAQAAPGIPALGKAGIVLLVVLLAGIGVVLSRRFV
jgi:hypothetical protein